MRRVPLTPQRLLEWALVGGIIVVIGTLVGAVMLSVISQAFR